MLSFGCVLHWSKLPLLLPRCKTTLAGKRLSVFENSREEVLLAAILLRVTRSWTTVDKGNRQVAIIYFQIKFQCDLIY